MKKIPEKRDLKNQRIMLITELNLATFSFFLCVATFTHLLVRQIDFLHHDQYAHMCSSRWVRLVVEIFHFMRNVNCYCTPL
jgi:hypothetical protein